MANKMSWFVWGKHPITFVFCMVLLFSIVASIPKPKAKYFIGRFGKKVSELRQNCLGVDQIQNEINKKVTVAELFDGNSLIKTLSSGIRKRFTDRIAALQELKKGVEEDYTRTYTEQLKCCKLQSSSIKYNSRFKTKVDPGHFCELRSTRSDEDARGLGDNAMETMYKNLKKNHRLKWQYFGSAEGVTTIFPSSTATNCGKYDNRVRPWYINTASPVNKNIVIVLDTSTSMASPVTIGTKTSTILAVAKAAVNAVLSTLLPKDKVGVVLFNTKVLLPGNDVIDACYSNDVASASAFNVNQLKTFVNGAKAGGGTHYSKGFSAAFKLLINSATTGSPKRQSVILFITDGPPSDITQTIIQLIKKHKLVLNKYKRKVTIVTYGIGKNIKMKRFLEKLSKETGSINNHVNNIVDLHAKLISYYKHVSQSQAHKAYTVSPPYVDAWGLGVLVTVATSCVRDGLFKGVAGIDITLPDLLSEIQYFNQAGPFSYAFIAHQNGNVLSHPQIPPPETVTKDPSLVHILSLERGEGFEKLFEQMKSAEDGENRDVWIPAQRRSAPRGGTIEEGVLELIINSHYSCSKVLDYVVCVVLAEDDVQMNIKDTHGKVSYHRMDLFPQGKICYYADSLSYQDKSVVQFSAKAFRMPSEYLDFDEIPTNVTRYLNYINHGKGPHVFHSDVAATARMGDFLDKLWIHTGHQEYLVQIPRRFFGAFNGVLRFFPGEPLPLTYDHSNRHWYLKAKTSPDLLMFTTPYRDPLGAGIIITISHSITMATKNPKETSLFGVVAADLTISYLDILVKNELGFRCKDTKTTTCFLVDTAGYVVFHPRFVQRNVYDDVAIVKNKHVTEIHGHVAQYLINAGVMKKRKCQNFSERRLQIFYELEVGDDILQNSQETTGRCDVFAITRVSKTNIYVVAAFANAFSKCYDSASCFCGQSCKAASNASFCECPCTQPLTYNYCSDTIKETVIPSCTTTSAKVALRPLLPPNTADLPKCFNPQCEELESEGICRKTFGCSWCKWENTKELDVPFCTYDVDCYGGVRGRRNPFLRISQTTPRNVTHIKPKMDAMDYQKDIVIGGLAGSCLLLVLVITICIYCFCCRKKTPDEQPEVDGYYNETEMQDGMYTQGYQEGYMLEGEGYTTENVHGYGGYVGEDVQGYTGQDGQVYGGEYNGQEYYMGEQLLPESEMFDDF